MATAILNGTSLAFTSNGTTENCKLTASGSQLQFTGQGGSGNVIISGIDTPTSDNHVASKSYVDSVANGLNIKNSVKVATTSNLNYTYNNDNGTLTNIDNGAVRIDDDGNDFDPLEVDDRVLVKNQTTASQNGIYKVTKAGGNNTALV